jgi:ATP-dependent Clp protease ATP-binding subunit ClpA
MSLKSKLHDARTLKELMTRAEDEARGMGDEQPAAEHLLLAALALPDGTARRAFERVGADPDGLRDAIEAQYAGALLSVGVAAPAGLDAEPLPAPGGVYRSSASARSAFTAASELARAKGSPGLRGAHVVAAVAELEHGTAARALTALGVGRAELRAAALASVR